MQTQATKNTAHAAACLIFLWIGAVQAQDQFSSGEGFVLDSSFEASAIYSDNLFYQKNAGQSSSGFNLKPNLLVRTESGPVSTSLNLGADYGYFDFPGDLDDYFDWNAGARLNWRALTRHRFTFATDYKRGHDPFGSLRTENTPAATREIDEWELMAASVGYRFGAPGALVNSAIKVGTRQKDYTTNKVDTAPLNFDVDTFEYEFFYNYSPKTSWVLDLGVQEIAYDQLATPATTRDGTLFTARTGLRWQATGKTSGDFRIGLRNRESERPNQPANRSVAWAVSLDWNPLTTTKYSLQTGRRTNESFRNDTQFIDDRFITLDWNQTLTARLGATLGMGYSKGDFVGIGREDEVFDLTLATNFRVNRSTSLVAGATFRRRDSSDLAREFESTIARLGIRIAP